MMQSRQSSRGRRSLAGVLGVVLIAAASMIPLASVAAAEPSDMVLQWNLNAVTALSNAVVPPTPPGSPPPPPGSPPPGAGQTPPVASIHLAMVQGAVYDAVNAIDGHHQPYLDSLPSAPASASKAAAAATAAHDVLVEMLPALPTNVITSLNGLYAASLAGITNGQAKTDGIAIGAAAADEMLTERAGDGRYGVYQFTPGANAGEWRVESPTGNDPFAWVSNVRPFTLTRRAQFRTEGPYDLDSRAYAREYNEVKRMGGSEATGSDRTAAQTLEARFFSANPLPMMNAALRDVAAARGLSNTQAARLFGMSSLSGADALIGCWDDKDYWSFWRPITAIREAANDGNNRTEPYTGPNPPGWLPLLTTPPYPDHPSGYNCYSAAMMYSAKRFFGTDHASFQLASSMTGTTRSYNTFTSVLKNTIEARVWLGIHFRNPDVQGAGLGRNVAKWVDDHFFEKVRSH